MSSIQPPSAATSVASRSQLTTFTPFDQSESAAPTGLFSRIWSSITTVCPSRFNAMPPLAPPMPAPTTMILWRRDGPGSDYR